MRLIKAGRRAIVGSIVVATAMVGVHSAEAVGLAETKTVLTATSATNPPPAGQTVYLRASVKPVVGGVRLPWAM